MRLSSRTAQAKTPKYCWLIRLYLDPYGPLESSLPYFFLFLLFVFVYNVYYLFSLLLIGILLLRPYESIKTPDSY
ncbi:hypothetical protein L6452_45642 [Arctium lappa]|nr:hypothetical protein L6452_45642 [Arctium lappa]